MLSLADVHSCGMQVSEAVPQLANAPSEATSKVWFCVKYLVPSSLAGQWQQCLCKSQFHSLSYTLHVEDPQHIGGPSQLSVPIAWIASFCWTPVCLLL